MGRRTLRFFASKGRLPRDGGHIRVAQERASDACALSVAIG